MNDHPTPPPLDSHTLLDTCEIEVTGYSIKGGNLRIDLDSAVQGDIVHFVDRFWVPLFTAYNTFS
jgi:hypothetical protein